MKNAAIFRLDRKPLPPQGVITRPYIRVEAALLCGECSAVYEAVERQECPACGSRQACNLGRALAARRAG